MPPSVLYKYLSARWISVLARQEIRFTPPKDFNDPFEAFPRVGDIKRESVRAQLEPDEDLDDMMSRALPFFEENGPQMIYDAVSADFGALCLASEPDHPLLWAHYGDGHQGFAIGFDPQHPWFQECDPPNPPLDQIQRVVYAEDRPAVTIGRSEDLSEAEKKENARAMMCTKHRSWKYEGEWRLIRDLDLADSTVDSGTGEAVHLFRFPSDAVTEVILGARRGDDDAARIKALLKTGRLGHARLLQARRSPTTFRFDLFDLETA